MSIDLNFKDVCKLIKKDEPKLIEAVDKLLTMALICSPTVIGPAAAVLLPFLSVKNELVKLGKDVFDSFSKKKDEDYVAKQQRMQVAYSLLVFTAFFEALDRRLPKELRDKIGLLESEKMFLAEGASGKTSTLASELPDSCALTETPNPIATQTIAFPHPTESLSQQVERHVQIWKQMGQGFQGFLQSLAVWDNTDDKKRAEILVAIEKIPETAVECFEAQYFELARKYEDFAVWANLQEHKKTKALIESLSSYVQQHAILSKAGKNSVDIGFAKLHETVLSIPETLKVAQATEIVESLKRHYDARINEPIIEEKDEAEEDKPRLSFPRVCDAFIPQSFRVLRQVAKSRRFEDEATWQNGMCQ